MYLSLSIYIYICLFVSLSLSLSLHFYLPRGPGAARKVAIKYFENFLVIVALLMSPLIVQRRSFFGPCVTADRINAAGTYTWTPQVHNMIPQTPPTKTPKGRHSTYSGSPGTYYTLVLQIAQSRSYLCTLAPKVGIISLLGALGILPEFLGLGSISLLGWPTGAREGGKPAQGTRETRPRWKSESHYSGVLKGGRSKEGEYHLGN